LKCSAKIRGIPPLYRAERKELALWASLVRRLTAEVAEGEKKGVSSWEGRKAREYL
jgi:hypothetical protein